MLKNHPIRKNTTDIKTDKNTKHHRRERAKKRSLVSLTLLLSVKVTSSFLVEIRYDEKDDALYRL